MTRSAPALLVAAVLVALAACGPDRASAHPDVPDGPCDLAGAYALGGALDDVIGDARVLANGLPVWKGLGFTAQIALGTGLGTRLTPALVSGRNEVAVEVVPTVSDTGDGPAVGPARLRLWVCAPDGSVVPGTERSAAHVDSVVAAWTTDLQARWDEWGPAAVDSARAWAEAHPVRVATSFERPAGADGRPADGEPAFDAVVREAPVIAGTPADSARLRAYAVELLRLNAERDTMALWGAFEPSREDRYQTSRHHMSREEYEEGNWDSVVLDDPVLFQASDVKLRSWADGRVWELYRDDAEGLLQKPERGPFRGVYVGQVDGELRVVRTNL